MNITKLFSCIKDTVQTIDKDLQATAGKGIFFAPELYTAFSIGRDIKRNSDGIFETSADWLRETNFGCGGPTDVAFKFGSDDFLFMEVKLRDTFAAYKADIEKLKRLNLVSQKLFCVLLDSFTSENDSRLCELQKEFGDNLLQVGHHSFPTWNDWYKKQIFCNLNLYSIK